MWLGKLHLILLRNEASGLLPTPASQEKQSFERKGRKWILLFFSLEHSIIKCTFFPHVPLISHSTSIQWSRITYNILYWNELFRIGLILKP